MLQYFTIMGDCPSKKNSQQLFRLSNGRVMTTTNKKYKEWHKRALPQLYGVARASGIQVIRIVFHPGTRRKADLTNRAESVMDLLVDAKILPDDNWDMVPNVLLEKGSVDRTNPRVEVWIQSS